MRSLFTLCLLACLAPALAQDDPLLERAHAAYERGYYLEHGLRDLDAAIEAYARAVTLADEVDRELAGRALFRQALCERQRGDEMRGLELLNEVEERFGDLETVAALLDALASARVVRRTLEIHDIELLTRRVEDQPGPWLRGSESDGIFAGGALSFDEEQEGYALDPDELIDLVMTNIEPDSWEHERASIDVRGGRLFVVQTPEVHVQVERYLDHLRSLRGRLISFDVRALLLSGAAFERLLGAGSFTLDAAQLTALEAGLAEGTEVTQLYRQRLTAQNDQVVHVAPLRETSYLADFRVDNTGSVPALEPDVWTLLEGLVVELHPRLVGADDQLLLESRWELAELAALERAATVHGELQLPRYEELQLRSHALVASGHTALLGSLRLGDFGLAPFPDTRLVFLVDARLSRLDAGRTAPVIAGERRQLRLYNVALLTQRLTRLDPDFGLFLEFDEDDHAFLDEDALIELILSNLSPDSWENDLNALDIIADGALLVVVQTPEVHAQVAAFLDRLRRQRGRLFRYELAHFRVDTRRYNELLAGTELSASGASVVADSVLLGLAADEEVALLHSVGGAGLDGASLSARLLRHESFVETHEAVAQATGSNLVQLSHPRIGEAETGFRLQLRARATPDGRNAMVDLDYRTVRLAGLEEEKTRWQTIHLPTVTRQTFSSQLAVPLDRVLLVGAVARPGAQANDIVLLRVRALDVFGE